MSHENEPGQNPAGPAGSAAPTRTGDQETPPVPPVEARVRHWHHWRTGGLVVSTAGVIMLIAGHFTRTGRAMEIGGFFILAGAVLFTCGVIGGWITRERPLD